MELRLDRHGKGLTHRLLLQASLEGAQNVYIIADNLASAMYLMERFRKLNTEMITRHSQVARIISVGSQTFHFMTARVQHLEGTKGAYYVDHAVEMSTELSSFLHHRHIRGDKVVYG